MEVTEGLDSFSIKDDAELPSFLSAQLEQAEQQLMPPMHTDQVETAARRNTPTQLPTVEGNTTITSPHNQQLDDLDSGDCRTTYIDNGTQLDEDFMQMLNAQDEIDVNPQDLLTLTLVDHTTTYHQLM